MSLFTPAPPTIERVGELTITNGLVEATGVEHLAAVAQKLLDDRTTHLGIVRNCLPEEAQLDVLNAAASGIWSKQAAYVYEKIPEIEEVDKVVAIWFGRQALRHTYETPGKAKRDKTKGEPSPAHIDSLGLKYIPGPLTLSVRIDNNSAEKRIFHAKRWTYRKGPTVLPDGKAPHAAASAHNATRWARRPRAKFPARVEHDTGAVIIFPNHPWPSIHRVDTEHAQSASMLLDYRLVPKSGSN